MTKRWVYIFIILINLSKLTQAQQHPQHFIGIDWGCVFYDNEPADMKHLKGMPSMYEAYNGESKLLNLSFKGSAGLKMQWIWSEKRIGLAAGLRYSYMNEIIGLKDVLFSTNDYFFWKYATEGSLTRVIAINHIMQQSDYLGTPVEFIFFPQKSHAMRFFLKAGVDIAFQIRSRTHIEIYYLDTPQSFYDIINSQVSKPSSVNCSFYNSFGIRMASVNKPDFCMEVILPAVNIPFGSSGILRNTFGMGIQFSLLVPLKNTK